MEIPPGAKYAQYKAPPDPNEYDYSQDTNKFDILDRGKRAAMSGVPKSKLIADIGHDLKSSIKNEINKIRGSIKV